VRSELLGACDAKEPGAGAIRAKSRTLAERGAVGKAIRNVGLGGWLGNSV